MKRKIINGSSLFIFFSLAILFAACKGNSGNEYSTWEVYGGSKKGTRYSSLTQIDTNNVTQLQVAWTYNTNDADTINHSQIQCNPIIINSTLYGSSPQQKIFAIDAATGKQKWVFNPLEKAGSDAGFFIMNNTRGIAYWSDGKEDERIFFTAGSFFHCLDAKTGKLVKTFGNDGKIDLHDGLDRDVKGLYITYTSPAAVYKDLIIVGSRVDEGANAAPGHIRAYNVRSGKQEWIFHTIPQPGEDGYESWEDPNAYKHIGGANCWSGFTIDEQRGLVFAATGSASYDFYGGMRKGANLYADCVLALDANTGKRKWHFQQIHHDLWDKDLPTPPALITVTHNGKKVDAVAQPTKTGFVFLLDRETGKPLFDVKEMPVPTETDLAGEKVFATQPYPVLPKPFVRQSFNEADINKYISIDEQNKIKDEHKKINNGHMFNPPSQKGTVIFPGYDGGAEWSGPAYDESTGLLYINANEMPWILKMLPVKNNAPVKETNIQAAQRIYKANCMACHGVNLEGGGNYPSLQNMQSKYSAVTFNELLMGGRRMMPAFKQLSQEERNALASFILNDTKQQIKLYTGKIQPVDSFLNMPYTGNGYNRFLTASGMPAINPPWGTLTAINMNTGQTAWQIPLGENAEMKKQGIISGTENYGGPAVTAGGLIFIGATADSKLRAFNKYTGKLLWEYNLPTSAFATPSVYEINGKQYVVIACGGGKMKTTSGDSYIAFAL